MNLNAINTKLTTPATSFGCNNPNCNCSAGIVASQQPAKDTLEITKEATDKTVSFGKKVLNATKKAFNYVKTHKTQVNVCLKSAVDGLLTACTVLGAGQMIESSFGSPSVKGLTGKCAIVAGIATTGLKILQNKKAFTAQPEKK